MDRVEYEKMHAVEERMWWFHGIHANLLTVLGQSGRIKDGTRILDAGCGTGGFLLKLRHLLPRAKAAGMDFEPVAASLSREKSGADVCVGSINALPFDSASMGAIVSADVLCHQSVDEAKALADMHRCLQPGGVLLLNLPAYDWMFSAHDRAVHTARRYTSGRITALLTQAGFVQVRTTYWNTILFPLMMLQRKLLSTDGAASDVMPYPAPVEALCRMAMRVENLLIKCGLRLPFGGSVLAMAIKHD